jgi:hypothetical protein
MEDLGKTADEGIELKPKKPRSEAQLKAFEKAREIRLENAKLKKEKIAQIKEEVKNRNKAEPIPAKIEAKPVIDETTKIKKEKKIIEEDSEEEVVVVKKKKKPKVIYVEESDDEPPPTIIKKQKEPQQPVLVKPIQSIRFF